MSSWVLSTSKNGDFTASLSNLFQCLITDIGCVLFCFLKKCLLVLRWNLLVRGLLGAYQDPQGLFCKAAFHTLDHQHALVPGFIPPQRRDFVPPFAEFHEVPVWPFRQPVKVPVKATQASGVSTISLCCVSSANLFEMRFPPSTSVNKDFQ